MTVRATRFEVYTTHVLQLTGSPSSISVRRDISGHQVPQAIAHRGFSAKFPENTMSSFTAAIKAGAHGLETDVHLSKDDVVVLSHVRFRFRL
jgi:phosphatidylglycerol phospholipase C